MITETTLAANEVQIFGEGLCRYLIRLICSLTTKTFNVWEWKLNDLLGSCKRDGRILEVGWRSAIMSC